MQTEEDLELQAERDGDRLAAARHEAGEVRREFQQCLMRERIGSLWSVP
jgi:hypothetical protein